MDRNCCVCTREKAAYKCPTCYKPYTPFYYSCCVACCQEHKNQGCESLPPVKPVESPTREEQTYDFPTEDTVPVDKLHELRHNEDIKDCLQNPHLRNMMIAMLADADPTQAIAAAMADPIFVELADACLKTVEPERD